MKEKLKGYVTSLGFWWCFIGVIELILAIMTNFTDWSGNIGGWILLYVYIPYTVLCLILGTIKAIKAKKAANK